MEKVRVATFILALSLAVPLAAQDPHFGLGLSLSIPVGGFNSTDYGPSGSQGSPSNEGYDTTLGGQFTVSFPVAQQLAVRLDIYGQSTTGEDTAPGLVTYNLRHQLFSLGGEAQYFLGTGDAYRHRGAYVVGGLSMDLENFKSSYGDPDWFGYSVNKTRLGGLVGAGYSFRPFGRWRTNAEVAFHKTLTGDATSTQPTSDSPGTPPADFFRLTYGVVF
ncbi:MAG: outer membrane beta-barrel protein [Holophaga sp.]|nr:outer membrane beta-barrel protein [Holophaga sp.]